MGILLTLRLVAHGLTAAPRYSNKITLPHHETLYVWKDNKVTPINQTLGTASTIKMGKYHIHNVYKDPYGERAQKTKARLLGTVGQNHLFGGDFNRCGLRIHNKRELLDIELIG